jgi:FkbM family methyltransferase
MTLDRRLEGTGAAGVLARLWAWQLWRRIVRRPVRIRCAEGSLLLAPPWSRAAAVIAGTGLTERDDAIFVIDLLRAGDLFVDVGANIGFYTVVAARRGAQVRAYEPTLEASEACRRSVSLNGVDGGVSIHRVACGAASGVTRFTTGLDISNHIVEDGQPGIEVPIRTLDAELADADPPLTMLKVDAEGHDMDVLRGAIGAIERLRPVIQVEIWTGGAAPLGLLEHLGYRGYSYDPAARALTEAPPGYRRAGNLLLIADATLEGVRQRVAGADRPALRAPSVRWLG